jgi:septum site-determining protein MinC
VTLLRGRRDGLEVTLSPLDLQEGFTELQARLTEQPSFYRGAAALVNFGAALPSPDELRRLRELLAAAGISLRGVAGLDAELEGLARQEGLVFESPREELEWRRELRPVAEVNLSESARSLVPDFAGARKDIAQRRRRGEASVPRLRPELLPAAPTPALHVVEAAPGTLYRTTTLRGGQVLHHSGNIVVVGDVNPGAELIATGDILVFGRLAGIAHAGAQGEENARIYALDLAPTQLRIATFIAAEGEAKRRSTPVPEVALARDGRIVILALDHLGGLETFEVGST